MERTRSATRRSTRQSDGPAPFANDPVRGPPLPLSADVIQPLLGPNFLSTALVDYMLQSAMKDSISDNILIGSANAFSFFEIMNKKTLKSSTKSDARTVRHVRERYRFYSFKKFHFLAANCSNSHFFVIKVIFDIQSEEIFQHVTLYDSLRRTGRNNKTLNKNSIGAQFLLQFQRFMTEFCFFEVPRSKVLINDPDFILRNAVYADCPQQQNSHDCALFAFAVLLHLAHGKSSLSHAFTQSNITDFRLRLYENLDRLISTKNEQSEDSLPTGFFHSFFPQLSKQIKVANPPSPTTHTSSNEQTKDSRMEDKTFYTMFMEKDMQFQSLQDLDRAIDEYEETSGFRIIIKKSDGYARTYICKSHLACCFRAKFGKVRRQDYVILKKGYTTPFHCGDAAPTTAKGRAHKRRLKGRVEGSVEKVESVKDGEPQPKDVMKTAANLDGLVTTYNQSFRAIQAIRSSRSEENKLSFQLIQPYLNNFMELNPGSTTRTETDGQNNMKRVFLCPAMMDTSMRYVRPVMSLDAAHMKSHWKGTLYIASVKTACDEIYPVAFAIMCDNENASGWKWFLELLRSSLPMLVMEHPKCSIRYKYFSFMSDRQKGLVQALQEVFPENLSCYCAIHIARNAERNLGKKLQNTSSP